MGMMEYFLRTVLKIGGVIVGVTGGALCVRVLYLRTKKKNRTCLILFVAFLLYLVGVAYLTIFSRTSSPGVVVELQVFRGVANTLDLLYKFIKSCYHYIVEHVWVGVQRPDVNIPYIEEGTLNILLFVPFGYLFPAVRIHKKRYTTFQIVCIGFSFSLLIEVVQLLSNTGSFDLDDLINNTVGTFIGGLLFARVIMPAIRLYKKKDLDKEVMYDT